MPHDDEREPEDNIAALMRRQGKLTREESALLDALLPEIVDTHGKNVLRQIQRRIKEPANAEEIAQEIFITLTLKLREEGFLDNVGGMLHRITEGKLLNHACVTRRNIVSVGLPSSSSAPPQSGPDAETALTHRAQARQFFEALSLDHQDAVDAVIVRGLSHAEAAWELDIPVATLASRLQAAKQHMKKLAEALPSSQQGWP